MGTSEEQRQEAPDELELEPETVKDLDVSAQDALDIRGGSVSASASHSK